MKIVFVCASNICRSPYAEFVFRKMCGDDRELGALVESVSSAAAIFKHTKINSKTYNALTSEGFDSSAVSAHVPSPWWCRLGYRRCKDADILIGMNELHRYYLPPSLRKKYFTLSVLATGEYVKIPDPVFFEPQRYLECLNVIKNYLFLYGEKLKSADKSADNQ